MISGNIVDVLNSKIYSGTFVIENGRIVEVIRDNKKYDNYIIPGFIDSHVHIESSMLIPSEFARLALVHGTVATVSDPHEIANVMGISGVDYMLENARSVPLKFYFSVPSCVPFEKGGGIITIEDVERLMGLDRVKCLGEVMNYVGVLNDDKDILQKIDIAKKYYKAVDGHAPELSGDGLVKYVNAGITTDHECICEKEALEKIALGMMIQIREGSAAKNFDALAPIIDKHYKNCMFASDDKHPDDLLKGHINELVKRCVKKGIDVMKALRMASVNPIMHYNLDVGMLQPGDYADFLEVDNLTELNVLKTYINGKVVAEKGRALISRKQAPVVNNFNALKKLPNDFSIKGEGCKIKVIEAVDGQLITNKLILSPKVDEKGNMVSDIERDILKIVVVDRYKEAKPAVGFIKNFGFKHGAIASSVTHDSHNIIAVGVSDEEICRAVNMIIEQKGGISIISNEGDMILPLSVAGIISAEDSHIVIEKYAKIDKMVKKLKTNIHAPFMTLSFMALVVIPRLKISVNGLFDGEKFEYTSLFVK